MARSALAPAWLPYPESVSDAHHIDPVMWPDGVERGGDGVVTVHGVSVAKLAEDYGTPLLVLDEDDFRARARAFRTSFNAAFDHLCGGVDVYYASKSLLTVDVARWAREEGLRVDTASGGELALALRGGVDPADIGLHGNNKSDAEIHRALEVGVGRIVVDSLDELHRVAELAASTGQQAPVMLRLTPGVHAHTHDYIATAHEDQKFGLSMAPGRNGEDSPALEAVRFAAETASIKFLGLHCHIGSQIFEAAGFGAAAEKLLTFIAEIRNDAGIVVKELDLGGGHGIAYTPADTPRHPEEIAQTLAALMRAVVDRLGIDCPRVSIEPGRAISGPAGFTLYTVGVTKTVQVDDHHSRRYVAVDGGMSDNPRPVLYDADYTAMLASRVSEASATLSRVVGKHCESGDIVVRDGYLPEDVGRGDLLAIPATGAYTHVMSSNYNMLPRPAIVAVSHNGPRLIIRRETEADLFAREVGLADVRASTPTTTDNGGS